MYGWETKTVRASAGPALRSALTHRDPCSLGPGQQRPGGSGVGSEGQGQCTAARTDPSVPAPRAQPVFPGVPLGDKGVGLWGG